VYELNAIGHLDCGLLLCDTVKICRWLQALKMDEVFLKMEAVYFSEACV
jgi:hypothetical protein